MDLKKIINSLNNLEQFYGKSMLETIDWTDDELDTLLNVATMLQEFDLQGKDLSFLKNKLFVALFFDKSTRTKASWAGAASKLGGVPIIMEGSATQVSHGETAEETGVMIGMNAHAVGIRHDIIIGEGNSFMRDAERGINKYLAKQGLTRRVPFVNLQCDVDHPTQTLADLMKLREIFPEGLKGKKMVVSWAYSPSYAKPLSVPQGLITLMTRFGMHVMLAHPQEYKLMDRCVEVARKNAEKYGGSFKIVHDMDEAFKGADIVYPKSWGPYNLMLERIEANRRKDEEEMKQIEKRCLELNAKYKHWICDEKRMALTNDAKYMHCLPADIGSEVSKDVFEKHKDFVYSQANKKLYIIMALLALSLVKDLKKKLLAVYG